MQPGKLIDEKEYFALQATDTFGQVWTSKDIWVDGDVSFPTSSIIVRAKLRSIEATSQLTQAATTRKELLIVPGKYTIPFNDSYPGTGEAGFTAGVLDLGEGRTCRLRTRDSALIIDIECNPGDPPVFPASVVEAIGVAVGAHLVPCVTVIRADLATRQQIHRANVEAQQGHRLFSPIPMRHPGDFADFQEFVRAYVQYFHEPYAQVAEYWYRVLLGFHSGFENTALVLCTAIEGTLKAKFAEQGRPEPEFLDQIEKAIPEIEALKTIGPRARERLLGSLGLAKMPTAATALRRLSDTGVIPPELAKVWRKLRNKTAHAAELTLSSSELQMLFNQTCACLELFYRFIMDATGYKGQICQYSEPGWPEGRLIQPTPARGIT